MDAVMKHPRPNSGPAEVTARRFTLGTVRPHTSAKSREKKSTCRCKTVLHVTHSCAVLLARQCWGCWIV